MINWIYYPQSDEPPPIVQQVVGVFEAIADSIDSKRHQYESNEVLERLRPGSEAIGFEVESGKKKAEKI